MNEKWRDYSKYTDKQLDDLLKGFAGQADYPAVVFEYQRRQNALREADNKSRHKETQRLARWAMIFAALSVVVGTVFGLTQNCSNKPPSSATHSEASTGPSITPLQQTEPHEPRQTPTECTEETLARLYAAIADGMPVTAASVVAGIGCANSARLEEARPWH
jgi:hypothetical protein